jgi:hypothetical protein
MRKTILVVLAVVGLPATESLATHPGLNETMTVFLNGHNEVGPDGTLGAGDPDGTAVAVLENDHGTLVWSLNYQNISGETITGLHIHGPEATLTTNRDILISFPLGDVPPPGITLPNGSISGVVTSADDPGLLTKMAAIFFGDASQFYLNLHTGGAGGFPNGAVRGQLAVPEPTTGGLILLGAVGLLRRLFRRVA